MAPATSMLVGFPAKRSWLPKSLGGTMFRVEIRDSENALSLKLEGRFTGDDAENTRALLPRSRDGMRLLVDLTEVTFIDSLGEEVLSFFSRFGAEFVAQTSYALDVCERLHLRLARAEADAKTRGASHRNGSRRSAPAHQPEEEQV